MMIVRVERWLAPQIGATLDREAELRQAMHELLPEILPKLPDAIVEVLPNLANVIVDVSKWILLLLLHCRNFGLKRFDPLVAGRGGVAPFEDGSFPFCEFSSDLSQLGLKLLNSLLQPFFLALLRHVRNIVCQRSPCSQRRPALRR